jgi:hypothetical protein
MKNQARVSKYNFTKTIPLYYQIDSKRFFIIISGQHLRTSTNSIDYEVNDHINLQ